MSDIPLITQEKIDVAKNALNKGQEAIKKVKKFADTEAKFNILAKQPTSDAITTFMADKLGGKAGSFIRENPRLTQAALFLGLPLAFSTVPWALHAAFSEKKKTPSFWSYALPFMALGGGAWWLAHNNKLGDVANLFGYDMNSTALQDAYNAAKKNSDTLKTAENVVDTVGKNKDTANVGIKLVNLWNNAVDARKKVEKAKLDAQERAPGWAKGFFGWNPYTM